jgi:hypothetical protein
LVLGLVALCLEV